MSNSERKSHIPDEQLAKLTEHKLIELEHERDMLKEQLFEAVQNDAADPQEIGKLGRRIENHDSASDKLTRYRADMLEDAGDDEHDPENSGMRGDYSDAERS